MSLIEAMINERINPGKRIRADLLDRIRRKYGERAARILDEDSGPCPICGLNTYTSCVCDHCAVEYRGLFARMRMDGEYLVLEDRNAEEVTRWWMKGEPAGRSPEALVHDLLEAGIFVDEAAPCWPEDE